MDESMASLGSWGLNNGGPSNLPRERLGPRRSSPGPGRKHGARGVGRARGLVGWRASRFERRRPYQRRCFKSLQEIRDAFAGTSMSAVEVFDSLDVPDSAALKECAVQVSLTVGPSWESATVREVNVPTSFELTIRVLAPAERSALLSARTILRMAVAAVVT